MYFHLILLAAIIFFSRPIPANEPRIQVVTEDAYPLQYMENGQLIGPTTEVVEAILKDSDLNFSIKVLPWARAYQAALTNENTLIYSIARTKEREEKFQWVGSIFKLDYYLVGLKSLQLPKQASLADIKYLRIGAVRNSATHFYLQQQGLDNLYVVGKPEQNINMLKKGRLDLFPVHYASFQASCRRLGLDCQEIVPKVKLAQPSTALYLAFSKTSDEKLVEQVRRSYQKIMK